MGLRISSRSLMAVRVPLVSTWSAVWPSKEIPPQTITDPLPNRSCWRMLQAAERSPRHHQTLSCLSCAQGEPDLISEEYRVLMANLPTLMFSGKCQPDCTVLGCKYRSHLWTPCSHTTLKESVSDHLSRNVHISSLLEVTLWGSGSAPPVPTCTKKQTTVLLLGCCPPSPPSTSPSVLACPLVSPPCS